MPPLADIWAVAASGPLPTFRGDRLFALYTDYNGRMAGKTWLVEAQILENGRLVGSWVQVGDRSDTGPFVGLIVR